MCYRILRELGASCGHGKPSGLLWRRGFAGVLLLALRGFAGVLLLALGGCSAKDPPTPTPVYHVGVRTNSSSVNSWELNNAPIYTQPGVNGGRAVTLKSIPSQRGFEPNDPLAEDVYAALQADASLPTRYVSASAKDGIVMLTGTMPSAALKAQAENVARHVPGVRALRSKLTLSPGERSSP